jgi:hypothetical protein
LMWTTISHLQIKNSRPNKHFTNSAVVV